MNILSTLGISIFSVCLYSCSNNLQVSNSLQTQEKLLKIMKRHYLITDDNSVKFSLVEKDENSDSVYIHNYFKNGKYVLIRSKIDDKGNFTEESIMAVINICDKITQDECITSAVEAKLKELKKEEIEYKIVIPKPK